MSTNQNPIPHDRAEILKTLEVILEPGQVVELRALEVTRSNFRRPHIESGYFDNPEALAAAGGEISNAKGIHITPNPVNPALLARANNRVLPINQQPLTSDDDVMHRHWLLIDLDPRRPAGISSTDAEHEAALERAQEIGQTLQAEGWPKPIFADSGNGGHLLFRVDLPNDEASNHLLERCLKALDLRFTDEVVEVDTTTFNASRIWKLYGTLAAKGDHIEERPHRLSKLLDAPDPLEVVSVDLLSVLAAMIPSDPKPVRGSGTGAGGSSFDLERWIADHDLDVMGPTDWDNKGKKWVFRECPWNADHTNRSAFVVQFSTGAIAAGCRHNSCKDQDWHALRDLKEPDWREKAEEREGEAEITVSEEDLEAAHEAIEPLLEEEGKAGVRQALGPKVQAALRLLAQHDPARYERFLLGLRDAGAPAVEIESVRRAVKATLQTRERKAYSQVGSPYELTDQGLVWHSFNKQGSGGVPLTNFPVRIVADILEDDGVETSRRFELEATVDNRAHSFAIPAAQFHGLGWVCENLGASAILYPGSGLKEHARAAIQFLSEGTETRQVYTHTGWRKLPAGWGYLHAGGGIGQQGNIPGVEVNLPGDLARFHLPDPPEGEALITAIQASLEILEIAPDRITFPLFAAPYRAVITASDFSLHVAGPTGAGKSELAALAQQHLGGGLDARHLPGNWASTANSLEFLAFTAKDAVLVVDDFAPAGSVYDVQRLHREGDRLLRGQGNQAGRQRLRSDATLHSTKFPRGLIVSTGEEVPRGQSLRSRMLVLEISPDDLDWAKLTACQQAARNGLYAQTMSAFLRWLAGQYEERIAELQRSIDKGRQKELSKDHRRTPEIACNLHGGLELFLDFAQARGGVSSEQAQELRQRGEKALEEATQAHSQHVADNDPVTRFLELMTSALVSGQVHVATKPGEAPKGAENWGWRKSSGEYEKLHPQGKRVGWLDDAELYLEPSAAMAAAQELGRGTGAPIVEGVKTLGKRLKDQGILRRGEPARRTNQVRVSIEGESCSVWHLPAQVISDRFAVPGEESQDPPSSTAEHLELFIVK